MQIYFTTKSVKSNILTHVETISEEKTLQFMSWCWFYFVSCQWCVWEHFTLTNGHVKSSLRSTSSYYVTYNWVVSLFNVKNKVHWCVFWLFCHMGWLIACVCVQFIQNVQSSHALSTHITTHIHTTLSDNSDHIGFTVWFIDWMLVSLHLLCVTHRRLITHTHHTHTHN